tara:strand:+ start:17090 stop:17197 length:108 start_codon:yes stop_codon:yes gene_type:complete
LKTGLAKKERGDENEYAQAKTEFIKNIKKITETDL